MNIGILTNIVKLGILQGRQNNDICVKVAVMFKIIFSNKLLLLKIKDSMK